jgi:hypothetical protein
MNSPGVGLGSDIIWFAALLGIATILPAQVATAKFTCRSRTPPVRRRTDSIISGRVTRRDMASIGARYQVRKQVQLFVEIDNLLNHRYYTAAQLGPTPFDNAGNFVAQPFAPDDGHYTSRTTTFLAPGAPFGARGRHPIPVLSLLPLADSCHSTAQDERKCTSRYRAINEFQPAVRSR